MIKYNLGFHHSLILWDTYLMGFPIESHHLGGGNPKTMENTVSD